MKTKISLIVAVLVFAGCGDNNIDIVKNYTLPQNKSMTIGAAIDGYDGCEKVKWEDVSANDLKLVKATCEVSKGVLKAEFDKQNARYEEAVQKAKNDAQKNLGKALERIIKNYNDLKTEGSVDASKDELLALANKFCKYDEQKANSFSFSAPANCDKDGLKAELLQKYKLNENGWIFNNFLNDFANAAVNSQRPIKPVYFGELPKQINSRTYEVRFIINTDKSVDIDRKAVVIEDGVSKEIGSGIVRIFYDR